MRRTRLVSPFLVLLAASLSWACPPRATRPPDAGTACASSQIRCSDICIDPESDADHCGDCATSCPAAATCVSASCQCPGTGTVCGNACVDTSSDPQNCGACGHACTSGPGETALCSPDGCALIVTLDSRRNLPVGPLVDTTGIYWGITANPTNNANGAILRTPIGGGQATTLTTAISPAELAMDSSNIYWIDLGNDVTPKLLSVARTGGLATTLSAPIPYRSGSLATSGTVLFWPDNGTPQAHGGYEPGTGAIMSFALTTMQVEPFAPGQTAPEALATDATFLYWTSLGTTEPSGAFVPGSGGIMRTPLQTGGPTQTLVSGEDPCVAIAVDTTGIYWATIPPGSTTSDLKKMALSGAQISTLAHLSSETLYLAVDGRNLNWTTLDTSVGFVPRQGGSVVTLVTGAMPGPGGLAADPTGLYWTRSTGSFGNGMLVWLSPQ